MTETATLRLAFDFRFEDLYSRDGLVRLDARFLEFLAASDPDLLSQLTSARANPEALGRKETSALILALTPWVEDFVGDLFHIRTELEILRAHHSELAPLYSVKRRFVQRKALTGITPEQAAAVDPAATRAELEALFGEHFSEMSYARHVMAWLDNEAAHKENLAVAGRYAAWALLTAAGRHEHHRGILFKRPHKVDAMNLVPVITVVENGVPRYELPKSEWRYREGFALTDPGTGLAGSLDEANYCIHCHNQQKDSCSSGLREKDGTFKKSQFGVTLAGCPLEEKISEFHSALVEGHPLGALAIITIDNPMAAGTGHRICNDCMKACIFQKQEPVNIPQAETRTLKNVLELPWGFEIYSLLTRWNPLNFARPLPKPHSGRKVLVVGLGPAGYSLAHHLMNDGHHVVAVDGLKIEPLEPAISGVDASGNRVPFDPIWKVDRIRETLDGRVMAGFGGVAEYGITVRWDKNFLKMIRLLLERRSEFAMFGGVRFGGAITVDSAFEMGFDHVALCTGAGRPTVIGMKNGLARGVRQASDFLMALQLTGAARVDSVANLQLRLPVVVIGGGLTGVDTATESLAYYPVQVEKFANRYEILVTEIGEERVRRHWSEEERQIADEFLTHARIIREEKEAAAREGRTPDIIGLLRRWGGVTLAYRRRLVDAPSYTLNHEEVFLAMQEGIQFAEGLSPVEVETDKYGHAAALHCAQSAWDEESGRMKSTGQTVRLPARSVIVAAGTQPNTVPSREDPAKFAVADKYFRALDEHGNPAQAERVSKPDDVVVLTHTRPDGRAVSFFGDLHPSFAGNVVKAMGGARLGYPVVSRVLDRVEPTGPAPAELFARLNRELRAHVKEVVRLTPNIVEIVVEAPLAARAFHPGQFYRLQNFESLARRSDGTLLGMEGLALTGASVDHEKGLLSTIVLEMGGSSDFCALLQPGEPVVLMGPTGTPTETPSGETVLLVGGGLGNAVLFSIGQALRRHGSKVIYVAGYKKMIDRYKVDEIERAADVIVWTCDEAPGFTPTRPQDLTFVGNIVQAMKAYGEGSLTGGAPPPIPLEEVHRIIVIGSDRMMAAVGAARHAVLKPWLGEAPVAIGSINSPMQCMMKEICAQCLQTHRDPVTGKEEVVFSCFNQDQPLDRVDFGCLNERLGMNNVQEKLTKLWIDRCLRDLGERPVLAHA